MEVFTYDPGNDKERQSYDAQAFSPREADSNDSRSKLPSCRIEGVRDPVGNEAGNAPLPTIGRNGVEIFVGPEARMSIIHSHFHRDA
jgi:hypothetical protein